MKITSLGHAGFCVETSEMVVIMDPWLSPKGAFDSAWFQFPRNHHMANFVQEKLKDHSRERFIYISHEHKDHFDADFLQSLESNDFTFITPNFRRDELKHVLSRYPSKGVITPSHNEQVNLPNGQIKLFLYDNELNRDSAILLKSEGYSFLNLNDCKIFDLIPSIINEDGDIDVYTCQFSGASWHSTCYDYPEKTYKAIARKKTFSKFITVSKSIEMVNPRVFIPSAGPPCFLDPQLLHLNFEPVNIFPKAPKFLEFLDKVLKNQSTYRPNLMPGDVLDVPSATIEYSGVERVNEDSYESYIHSYASEYSDFFAQRKLSSTVGKPDKLLERLHKELAHKLNHLSLHNRIRTQLFIQLTDLPNKILCVDFQNKVITYVSQLPDLDYYSVTLPSWEVKRALDGKITWDDLFLTLRVSFNREPDIYQTVIHGFLSMQVEDMDWFCTKLIEFEEKQERIIVEAGGIRYSVKRFCPHQGADMRQAWIEEDRYLTCPRHRWQYDLHSEGKCTLTDSTIDAIQLEED